jgi:hypothetical protein
VGKNSLYQDNQKKNIELRINKDLVSMTNFTKKREYNIERGYSMLNTLKAHDIDNFIINKDRYYDIVDGKTHLVKHHPLDNKYETKKPDKYKELDVHRDFYDRRCPKGFRYNDKTNSCERF